MGYAGIGVLGNSFVCVYKGKTKNYVFLQDALKEYNRAVKEDLGEEGTLHEIPAGQTKVADLLGNVQNLSEETINKSTVSQIKSIISSNSPLMELLGITASSMICSNNEKLFKQQILNYKQGLPVISIKDMYTPGTMTLETLHKAKLAEIQYIWGNDKKSAKTICKYRTDVKNEVYEAIKQKMVDLYFPAMK